MARSYKYMTQVHTKWKVVLYISSVGHYPNTALFSNPKKKIPEQGSGLSSLGRIIRKNKVVSSCPPVFAQKLANFPEGLLRPMPRRPLMVRAALLAATELRRSRCCDGVAAATELRRPAPSRSFCASRGADAAATELMLRAALHCDGAATESLLRAATELLLRRSCVDQLRRAHSARRVSTRRAE